MRPLPAIPAPWSRLVSALALVAALLGAPAAHAGQQLDWDAQAWTGGSLTGGPYTLGNGTVSVAITGDTDDFNNGTPNDIDTLVDGGTGEESLSLSTDYDNGTGSHEVTVTFTFSHANGVRTIAFDIFDIDANGTSFIDQIEVYGTNASGTIYPTITIDAGFQSLGGANNNIVTGTASATGAEGTMGVSFTQTGITSITVIYRNTIASGSAGVQYMGIHDIDFTPEQDLSPSTKTVTDQDGGVVDPGDTLRYTVTVSNQGGVAATGVTVYDDVPANVSGWSLVSSPGGATDNSTVGGGANGTGLVWFSNITVAAGGTATIVYDVTVSGSAPDGTAIDNAASIYDTLDDVVVSAPTMFVDQTNATGQVKELYLDNAAGNDLTRTRPTGTTGTTVNESGNVNFDLDPDTAASLTLASGNIPVVLRWACTGTNTANRSITATLSTTSGTVVAIGNQNQTIACPGGALNTFGTSTFNINLAAATTFVAGTNFRLNIAVGAGSGTRNISVRPVQGGVYSRVELNALTVINVDTIGTYTATYPGGSLATDFTPGSTVYIRAVVSDPFGAYDIGPTGGTLPTIDVRDRDNTLLVDDATMTLEATGTATKTYEYPYTLATTAPAGIWPVQVTAYEGVEGTVTDTLAASFRVYRAEISIAKSSAAISDPVNGATNPKRIPGATVRYTITVSNAATATATADPVVITDVVPTSTTYVTGSLYESTDATCNTSDTSLSDGANADRGSISGSTITFGDSTGGTDLALAPGAARSYCYDVTVD